MVNGSDATVMSTVALSGVRKRGLTAPKMGGARWVRARLQRMRETPMMLARTPVTFCGFFAQG
jgi:hypothetical protein